MKVAVVTDDMETISQHFGRARHYLVYSIEDGSVKGREVRDKMGHGPDVENRLHHREGPEMAATHNTMVSAIQDCEVVIAKGMGRPAYEYIRGAGMKAYVTRLRSADEAIRALIAGNIDNHLEMLD